MGLFADHAHQSSTPEIMVLFAAIMVLTYVGVAHERLHKTVAALLGVSEIVAILAGGVAGMVWLQLRRWQGAHVGALIPFILYGSGARTAIMDLAVRGKATLSGVEIPLDQLFLSFLKVGAVLFGSGYVLVAYLEDRPVYIFDEWAADQDPLFKRFFYHEILPEMKMNSKTLLVITHDETYYHLADRIIKLEDGQLVEDSSS